MKKYFKRHLMGLLKLKHNHADPFSGQPSMSEALKCYECGGQVAKAEAIYKQRRRTHPEEFIYKKPEFKRSAELEKSYDLLMDRIRNDQLYRTHIERLTKGTEKQKEEEMKKVEEGFYTKNYEEGGIIKKIK